MILSGLKLAPAPKTALLALQNKSKEQEDGNPVDFLQSTYSKCYADKVRSRTDLARRYEFTDRSRRGHPASTRASCPNR